MYNRSALSTTEVFRSDNVPPNANFLSVTSAKHVYVPAPLVSTAHEFTSESVDGHKDYEPLDSDFTPERVVCEVVARSLKAQREILVGLQPGWDGYGAPSLDSAAVDVFIEDLRFALAGVLIPAPDLVPGGDGSLQAEWHRRALRLTFSREATGERYCWAQERATGREHEYFEPNALCGLIKWSRKLV